MDNITNAAIETMMTSPALQGVSKYWPKKWDRVPKRVRVLVEARPSAILAAVSDKLRGVVAKAGQEYLVWANKHGAVSAIMAGGQHLGLYPREFEVVEFHEGPLIRQAKSETSSQAVGTISQYPAAVEEPEEEA